jgi:hypothetical protein
VEVFSVRPGGRALPPVSSHVRGFVPPIVVRACEYATPTWPFASDVVVIVSVFDRIVNVKLTVAVCAGKLESVTWNVTKPTTGFVGIPVICPEALFRVNPIGSRPNVVVQKYGVLPPMAVSPSEYDVPTMPAATAVDVIVNNTTAVTGLVKIAKFDAPVVGLVTVTVSVSEVIPATLFGALSVIVTFEVAPVATDSDAGVTPAT